MADCLGKDGVKASGINELIFCKVLVKGQAVVCGRAPEKLRDHIGQIAVIGGSHFRQIVLLPVNIPQISLNRIALPSRWIAGKRSFPKLKIPHQSHADFCSTDTAGGLDNKKRRYAPRGGVAYRLFLWGFPKGATPPFGTRLCEAKCSVLYALSALP